MYSKQTHIIRSRFASLLLALFVALVLVKPIHLFTHHHDEHEFHLVQALAHSQTTVSGEEHENCPICEFEFCQYIPQSKFVFPLPKSFIACLYADQTQQSSIPRAAYHFQLRAPPVL